MTPPADERIQKPWIINQKEERILRAVHDYECLVLDDLLRLLGLSNKSRNYLGKTLHKLCDGKDYDPQQFLYRFPLPRPTAKKGAKTRVYCLGARAREVISVADAYRPTKFRQLSYSHVLHNLMLSRFIVLATTYFQKHQQYERLETRMCYQLARTPPRITVNTQGKETAITVIPDAWLNIERVKDGAKYPLWLEIDNGTENLQKVQHLLRNRLIFVTSPAYEQFFHTNAVLLCYVITEETCEPGDTRLNNMLRWTEDVLTKDKRTAWASLFRFTTVSYETMYEHADELFTQPVWYKPFSDKPVLLFDSET